MKNDSLLVQYLLGFICVVSIFRNDHDLEIWKIVILYGNNL